MSNENLIRFLRTNLKTLLIQNRKDGRDWSHRIMSEESYDLYAKEIISYGISNDTIGRFLDTTSKQKPSKKTLDIITEILIYHGQVLQRQIDSLKKFDDPSQTTIPINIFKVPRTIALAKYLNDLSAIYYTANLEDQNLATSCLRIEFLEDVFTIRVKEEIRLYEDDTGFSFIKDVTDSINADAQLIQRAVSRKALTPKASVILQGFAITDSSFFTSIMQSTAGHLFSLSFNGILFSDEDSIIKIEAEHNLGWSEITNNNSLNQQYTHSNSLIHILRRIAKTKTFYKCNRDIDAAIDSFEESDDLFIENWKSFKYVNENASLVKKFQFIFDKLSNYDSLMNVNLDDSNKNKVLLESLENRDFSTFIKALEAGANPNLKWPSENNPMIFDLAANGMTAWIKALLNCGRCNLRIVDENGLPPSHKPGVTAIEFGPSADIHYDPSIYQRYQEIADLLEAEEIKQLSIAKQTSKPFPT